MEQTNNNQFGQQRAQSSNYAPKAADNIVIDRIVVEEYTKKSLWKKISDAVVKHKKVVIIAGVTITLAILVKVFWKKLRNKFTKAETMTAAEIIAACEEEAAKQMCEK